MSIDLRPIERRVLHLLDSGLDVDEVARRFRRGPDHISQVATLARLPGRHSEPATEGLRPVERRVLHWRAEGASHSDIAARFGRSESATAQIEDLAHYKLARG